MDTVLNPLEVISIEDFFPESVFDSDTQKFSKWVIEENIIRASPELKVKENLEPGVYIIDVHRDYGIYCKKIKISTDELFIFKSSVISELIEEISTFWEKRDLYKENKLVHKRGVLLFGYPGTGKTSIISLLEEQIVKNNGVIFKVTGPKNLYYYTTFIKDYFRKIQPDTPIITILEDINEYLDISAELLDLLDGANHIDHNVIIATTNDTTEIDEVFLRPSRIDLLIEIPLPCEEVRREFLLNKNVPKEDLEELINKTKEFSLADLKELYISRYILGYNLEESLLKLKKEVVKKNYLNKGRKKSTLGI